MTDSANQVGTETSSAQVDSLSAQGRRIVADTFRPPSATPTGADAASPRAGRVPRAERVPRCSVVIPAYNEDANLAELYDRLRTVLDGHGIPFEIVVVDDGSTDRTLLILRELRRRDPRVRFVSLARNFGHEAASTAGLERADGDVVVLMDADLQDPPELIPELIEQWRRGFDVVAGQRRRRDGESRLKKATSWGFYRFLNAISPVQLPLDTGDFRLIDHRVVAEFRRMREQNRFVRGMVTWIGHGQTTVEFDRPPRAGGETKYGLGKLALLSLDAAIGFSNVPLRVASLVGVVTMVASMIAGLAVVVHKLFFGLAQPGYALLASGFFFVAGVQMLLLGIVGEYIGRIYTQVQQRPLYVVREETDSRPFARSGPGRDISPPPRPCGP